MRHPAVPPQKIERRIGRDARQPVRRLQLVLELILPLQRLDEGFLRQILRVGHIPDDAVNLDEDPAQIVGDEAILPLQAFRDTGLERFAHRIGDLDGNGAQHGYTPG